MQPALSLGRETMMLMDQPEPGYSVVSLECMIAGQWDALKAPCHHHITLRALRRGRRITRIR